jgi:hypothetical protein
MEALKPFLGKDLTLHIHSSEETIDVGNELLALLKKVISGLELIAIDKQVEVKRGSSLSEQLEFKVTYKDQVVPGVPIHLNYSGGFLKSGNGQTDEEGMVSVNPGRITSGKNRERVEARIDHESITANAVSDVFIRSIVNNMPPAIAATDVNILSPVLAVRVSSEGEHPGYDKNIREICSRKANSYHLNTMGGDETPDYSLDIDYRFEPGESAGGLTASYLVSELRFTDEQGNLIAREDIEGIKGVGYTSSDAREQAFETFTRRLERRYVERMLDKRF